VNKMTKYKIISVRASSSTQQIDSINETMDVVMLAFSAQLGKQPDQSVEIMGNMTALFQSYANLETKRIEAKRERDILEKEKIEIKTAHAKDMEILKKDQMEIQTTHAKDMAALERDQIEIKTTHAKDMEILKKDQTIAAYGHKQAMDALDKDAKTEIQKIEVERIIAELPLKKMEKIWEQDTQTQNKVTEREAELKEESKAVWLQEEQAMKEIGSVITALGLKGFKFDIKIVTNPAFNEATGVRTPGKLDVQFNAKGWGKKKKPFINGETTPLELLPRLQQYKDTHCS
jgi:hypothetical protein